jgi:hypothetical protein
MKRYVVGQDRSQSTLFPEVLDDYIAEDNPVRVVDVFVDELDLKDLGFEGAEPEVTGRPSYHPATLLKIYIYGYLNRIRSSRRLERETQRNVELIWLTGHVIRPPLPLSHTAVASALNSEGLLLVVFPLSKLAPNGHRRAVERYSDLGERNGARSATKAEAMRTDRALSLPTGISTPVISISASLQPRRLVPICLIN